MKTLQNLIEKSHYLREAISRHANWSQTHVNNIVNNLAQHASSDAVEIMNCWDTAIECAQLFDTYTALLDEFPAFAENEYWQWKGHFQDIDDASKEQKDSIKFYVLESQKRLRGITYRDE
ncbi:MAG: hypothetical protein AABY01_01555 [Nanoarchaeota archaeon]